MDFSEILEQNKLGFIDNIHIEPIDAFDEEYFIGKIEDCIYNNLENSDISLQIRILYYFKRKANIGLAMGESEKDALEKINAKAVIKWIDSKIKALKRSKSPKPIVLIQNSELIGRTNKFNGAPLELVYKFFMQLTEPKESPFLTEEEVVKFILRGFCECDEIKKQTINNVTKKQLLIWKLFHIFYSNCTSNSLYEESKKTKQKYVELISENFTNWEYEHIFENFANYNTKKWKHLKDL